MTTNNNASFQSAFLFLVLFLVAFAMGLMLGFILWDGSGYVEGFSAGGLDAVYVFDNGVCIHEGYFFSLDKNVTDTLVYSFEFAILQEHRRICFPFKEKSEF